MSDEGASYRAAGVDYDALDAGKRLAMAKALSTSPLLAARGGRALDASRGEPAFVFELGEQTLRVRGRGPRHEVDHRPPRARAAGHQPLRRRRLRHGRGDPQRPLLRRRAAAGRQRVLRDRRVGVVPAARALRGAAGGLAQGVRGRRLRVGRGRVAVAAGDARRAARSSSPARPWGRCPAGRSAILGERLGPGDEIVLVASSGLHANGASLARLIAGRLPDGYATRLPGGAHVRRGAAGAVGHVCAADRRAARGAAIRSSPTSATSPATAC